MISYPLDTLHNLIVLSKDPDAKYSPSFENATVITSLEWPIRVLKRCASLISFFLKYTLYATSKKLSCTLSLNFSFSSSYRLKSFLSFLRFLLFPFYFLLCLPYFHFKLYLFFLNLFQERKKNFGSLLQNSKDSSFSVKMLFTKRRCFRSGRRVW